MDEVRQEFAALVAQDPIPLARGALLIAKEEYPALNLDDYLGRLDQLAREGEQWAAGDDGVARAQGLSRFLFGNLGFAGNRLSFGDPRNSFLNEVLDRKLGIPISLSLVYLEVGRRLGINLEGVAFPGHFLVKAIGNSGEIVVDPFNQGVLLTREDLQARLQTAYGQPVHLGPAALRPASPRQILFRMLRNLKNIYTASSDWMRALAAMDRALLLEPRAVDMLLERAKLYEMLECFTAALGDLQAVVKIAPEHPAADALREKIVHLKREVARIN